MSRRLSRLGVEAAAILLRDPDRGFYGLELMAALGDAKSGSLYPLLHQWEDRGWLEGFDEDIDPVAEGRPPRRYLYLTPPGIEALACEVEAVRRIVCGAGEGIR